MSENGFSLIEVKVCCAVLAILTAVSYPFIGNIKQTRVLSNEIRVLYSSLQNGKIEAIKKNTPVVFKISKKGYFLFVDDGKCGGKKGDWVKQGCERELVNHEYQDGVTLDETTFTAQRTRFNGRVCMKAGSVVLKGPSGAKMRLIINTVGRIRIERI